MEPDLPDSKAAPRLDNLPVEIVTPILLHRVLSPKDYKTLRLVCKWTKIIVEPVLFESVFLSRLEADRKHFIKLSLSPHLAQHVRRLVFYELDLDSWYEKDLRYSTARDYDIDPSSHLQRFKDYLIDLAFSIDTFWLPIVHFDHPDQEIGTYTFHGQDIVDRFNLDFHQALRRFTNLNTFFSYPMPRNRLISTEQHPIIAGLYQTTTSNIPCANLGLRHYLFPFMQRRPHTIKMLVVTVPLNAFAPFLSLQPDQEEIFANLRILRLCFQARLYPPGQAQDSIADKEDLDLFVRALNYADKLKELTLYFPVRTLIPSDIFRSIFKDAKWEKLQTLRLQDFEVDMKVFIDFLARHGTTLRTVALVDCDITLSDLRELRAARARLRLRLTSIEVYNDDENGPTVYIPDDSLRRFLNGKHELDFANLSAAAGTGNPWITTHHEPSVRNAQIWDHEPHLVGVIDEDTGVSSSQNFCIDRLMSKKLYPDSSAEDIPEEDPFERALDNAPLWTWGRWRGKLVAFPVKDEAEEAAENDNTKAEAALGGTVAAVLLIWGLSWSFLSLYLFCLVCGLFVSGWTSKAEAEAAAESAADDNNKSRDCFETELWKFTSRNGAWAIGDEPLEYFERWGGSEDGDMAEPLPNEEAIQAHAGEVYTGPCLCTVLRGLKAKVHVIEEKAEEEEDGMDLDLSAADKRDSATCDQCWGLHGEVSALLETLVK